MIKELFLAITLGALLGFGVTGGYFALKNNNNLSTKNSPTPLPTLTEDNSEEATETVETSSTTDLETKSPITIDTPANNSVVDTSKIKISGSTTPDSMVIILTPLGDYSTTSDKSGKFETQVNIESGVNSIKITSIDTQDNQLETQLMVTYSTAQF